MGLGVGSGGKRRPTSLFPCVSPPGASDSFLVAIAFSSVLGTCWVLTLEGLCAAGLGEDSKTDSHSNSAELALAMQVGNQEATLGTTELIACHTA